ncbi:MAG TPA: type VI secretion system tip protein TssI/VgrG [Polyangiaceae bacterium]|nr:type VI secretion system tip protein TssI/VgrG [Polyangiaceae bacterium]
MATSIAAAEGLLEGLRQASSTIEIGGETYFVLGFELVEAVGAVASLACSVVDASRRAPPAAALLGRPATFRLSRGSLGPGRSFGGAVVEASRRVEPGSRPSTSIVVAPGVWRLGRRVNCRAFRRQTLEGVVAAIFAAAGLPADGVRWALGRAYAEREYAVQYRETDLEFLLRILTEEGIYAVPRHDDEGERLVLADDPAGLGPVDGPATLVYRPSFGPAPAGDHVSELRQRRRVVTDKVSTRDYDPKAPRAALDASAESADPGAHALEVYLYPGRFREAEVGRRRAENLLHALQATRDVVSGETPSLGLRPGLTFSIVEHPYAAFNREYLVTAVRLRGGPGGDGREGAGGSREGMGGGRDGAGGGREGTGGGREGAGQAALCSFEAVPTGTSPYRPARRPAARAVPGLQTATTAGPAGAEIHTNEQGEVKASFPWDRGAPRDERASPWARTLQVPLGGAMLVPRTGWEVAVGYAEGDLERPYVLARLYNGVTKPPYALPAQGASAALQTATTPGGGSHNELRLDDTKGREHMSFTGSKDMSVDVGNNTTESVKQHYVREVGSNHALNVTNSLTATVGAAQRVKVGGAQKTKVETLLVEQIGGSHELTIAGARSLLVGGDHRRQVGGDASVEVGAVQTDAIVGSASESALGSLTHEVGAALVEVTATTRLVSVAGHYAEQAGALKIVGTASGRDVVVSGPLTQKTGGAVASFVGGDRTESASATLTEVAGGAHVVKAANVTYEADVSLTVVMGASTLTLLPAMVAVAGVSIKLDGVVKDGGALVVDN